MAFRKIFFIYILVLIIGLIFIYPLLQDNFFITDDFSWINFARQAKNFAEIIKINWGSLYDPIINLYFFIAYQIFKLQPAGYYLFNLLLHITNTILLVYLISNFLKRKLVLFIIGLLFLFQYFGAETFFWISSVTHLLVTFWILLSLIFLNNYLTSQRIKFLFLNYLFAGLAFLTKEIAFPMLAIYFFWCLLFYKFYGKKIEYKRILIVILPLLIGGLFYGLAQYFILRQSPAMTHYFAPSLTKQISVISLTFVNLLLYWPKQQNFYYLLLIYLLLILPVIFLRKKSLFLYLFGFTWLLAYLFFCSLPAQESSFDLIPNRYGYLSSIGLIFIILSLFVYSEESRLKTGMFLFVIILLIGYNCIGIRQLDEKVYQPMSDYSKGVALTLPEIIRVKDLIYVLDGYPYDSNPNYLNVSLGLYYDIDKKVIPIFSDKRNEVSVDESKSYVVLKYNYSQKRWEIAKQN